MSLSFYVSGLWAIGLLVLSLGLASLVPARKPSFWRGLLLVGVIAAGARRVPNVILPVGAAADIEAYQLVAERVVQGEDIYSDPATQNRHPYLPFQMYWMAFSHAVAEALQAPFVMVVRLAPITADVLIACLLFAHTYSSPHPHLPLYCGLFYALNPIPVLVSVYHGQFDAIPALFTLLALVSTQKKPHVAGAWLGLGVLSKGWPVLAFPSLMTAIQGWKGS